MAYMARLSQAGIFAHIAAKGDVTAGAVAIKVATMNGRASLFTRSLDASGERTWAKLIDDAPEVDVNAALTRQQSFDRDLWIVEVEDPKGRTLLETEGLD